MDELTRTMTAAASGMRAQTARLRLSSENIANADTPGYHRKLVSFEEVAARDDARAVATGPVRLDETKPERIHDPSHPLAGADGYYEGSNVNPWWRSPTRARPTAATRPTCACSTRPGR